MILAFKTHWKNGNPTYFIPKIWKSIWDKNSEEFIKYTNEENYDFLVNDLQTYNQKLHTIRKGSRWKEGMKIHFAINNRTKDYFQFAPVIEVKSVQEISINKFLDSINIYIDDILIYTDSHNTTLEELAQNDGFDSFKDFIEFFFPNDSSGEFQGQIIHWTNLRY